MEYVIRSMCGDIPVGLWSIQKLISCQTKKDNVMFLTKKKERKIMWCWIWQPTANYFKWYCIINQTKTYSKYILLLFFFYIFSDKKCNTSQRILIKSHILIILCLIFNRKVFREWGYDTLWQVWLHPIF